MLNPEMAAALNGQFRQELAASHGYLGMAAHFEAQNLKGFAQFMRRQADEERTHAIRIFDYLAARGSNIQVDALPSVTSEYGSTLEAFEAAYEREKENTKSINEAYALATKLQDYASQTMLHWFIDEQVEEEDWCDEAVELLKIAGDDPGALLQLDARYGSKE
jgi:ferritin